MWERWDSDEQLGGFMNSMNHRPWTLISEWFYRTIAGIDAVVPGCEHVKVVPTVVGDLMWAGAQTETVKGTVSSKWELTETTGADLGG